MKRAELLGLARKGAETEMSELRQRMKRLEKLLEVGPTPGRKLSADARKRMSEAQKARWAQKKKAPVRKSAGA